MNAFGVALATLLVTAVAQAAPGDLDPSFGNGGIVVADFGEGGPGSVVSMAIQPNGKIVAVGEPVGEPDFALARYNANGTLDESFGEGGTVVTDLPLPESGPSFDHPHAVVIQPNGKIVAVGETAGDRSDNRFALARYNTDGSLDQSFGQGGIVLTLGLYAANAAATQPNGRIVAAGVAAGTSSFDFALARYNTDGSLDQSFGSGGSVLTDIGGSSVDMARAVAIQPNGKIVAGGSSSGIGRFDFTLARYNTDGSLDQTFGDGGIVLTKPGPSRLGEVVGVAIEPGGKIVAVGSSFAAIGNVCCLSDFALARYNTDGSLDQTFGNGGVVVTDFGFDPDSFSTFDVPTSLAIQPNRKIVAAGWTFPGVSGSADFALARYNGDGSLDQSFGGDGITLTDLRSSSGDTAQAVALQPNGKIVAGGGSLDATAPGVFALVRYDG